MPAALAVARRSTTPGSTCRCWRESRGLAQRRPLKGWPLPAAIDRVRGKLAAAKDGDRQMVEILGAVLTGGIAAVEAA